MFSKSIDGFHQIECQISKGINRYFEKRALNVYFRTITNIGGAVAEILAVLFLLAFSHGRLHQTAVACAVSLTISHMIVQVLKKVFPRVRPYLALEGIKVPEHPLADHSFPSGHSTAVFSVVIPLIMYHPFLGIFLMPLALSVAVSRIFLGLHYPSDVLAGIFLGTVTGMIVFSYMMPF
ncbi:phosphatase PAP2 family protein [Sporolactobacillus shoreae]|uniref:Phosphatase PAP2 family protein n=1 Tax=Sporolactobacillus shoreae TaxID=1465501 RepID=A0A4Z0GMM8_9BACL|nr:phosphatase PAP2 family protein [Sporolactobacillus shoreae]TGA97020.1 phosphatase PAP2 family protein [Sporolactobacillus shoreae]